LELVVASLVETPPLGRSGFVGQRIHFPSDYSYRFDHKL
jgi:hypothetical protein